MESVRLKSLLESLIFVAEEPLKITEMVKAIQALERREAKSEFEGSEEVNDELEPEIELAEAVAAEEDGDRDAIEQDEVSVDAAEQLKAKAEEEAGRVSKSDVTQALKELVLAYEEDDSRGITLVEVAGGWQFRTRTENAEVIRYFYQPKPTKLSKPGMETLSMVAYRQPITRAEIDEIRGVDSGGVLKTLCEKNLVRIVGKKDEPGKPMLYGTTHEFLELFQLKSLKELPTLRDYRDLEAEFKKQTGNDGVVTENEEEPEEERGLMDLVDESAVEPLSDEEEGILASLEDNIKDVRQLEKEIFSEEKSEKKESQPEANQENDTPPPPAPGN